MSTSVQRIPLGSGPASLVVVGLVLAAALLGFTFYDGIAELLRHWERREEYSHGYFIPVISAYLIWREREALKQTRFEGAWLGVLLCLGGLGLLLLGELSTIHVIVQYALIAMVAGLTLSLVGRRGMPYIWAPLVFLLFMVPLPPFLHQKLSGILQLLSSELGVQVIRTFGISVFLEGNVIDLGTYQLQVVEACNGLRYLFPLMSFGFLCAYLFQAPLWQRALVFLSAVPITIAMNSVRIGIIGVLVEYAGPSMAEGFLHDFEGWAVFMVCVGILLAEVWLLARFTGRKRGLSDALAFEAAPPLQDGARSWSRRLPLPYVAAFAVLATGAASVWAVGERVELVPERKEFALFPERLDGWVGQLDALDARMLGALKVDDYLLMDLRRDTGPWVNLYVAYYASQRTGQAAHSPQACIPAGGWRIRSLETRTVEDARAAGQPLRVNRVEIQRGDQRQLVYYWFQQQGRVLTSEYVVKLALLWDAVTRNRTDGALVRLTTPIAPTESWSAGDARLSDLARSVSGELDPYIPM